MLSRRWPALNGGKRRDNTALAHLTCLVGLQNRAEIMRRAAIGLLYHRGLLLVLVSLSLLLSLVQEFQEAEEIRYGIGRIIIIASRRVCVSQAKSTTSFEHQRVRRPPRMLLRSNPLLLSQYFFFSFACCTDTLLHRFVLLELHSSTSKRRPRQSAASPSVLPFSANSF